MITARLESDRPIWRSSTGTNFAWTHLEVDGTVSSPLTLACRQGSSRGNAVDERFRECSAPTRAMTRGEPGPVG